MALGDGIRRNVARISQNEHDRLRDAFVALRQRFYADGVPKWFKQDQIHQATHVHAFPHAEGSRFFRGIARSATVSRRCCVRSIHSCRFTIGTGPPIHGPATTAPVARRTCSLRCLWEALPNGQVNPSTRSTTKGCRRAAESHREPGGPAPDHHPKSRLWRSRVPSDLEIIRTGESAPQAEQYNLMRAALEHAHNDVHTYIGGTISNPHASFQDPFVFLLHSNVDRLFATWQTVPGRSWRLDPERVYGNEGNSDTLPPPSLYDPGILTPVEPWAGNVTSDPELSPSDHGRHPTTSRWSRTTSTRRLSFRRRMTRVSLKRSGHWPSATT